MVVVTHVALTASNFLSSSNRESGGDYVQKQMLAHHFSHYYNPRCRRMVFELVGVISPTTSVRLHSAKWTLYILIGPLRGEEDVIIYVTVG